MQTFLPYPDFMKSAMHLDVKRLGQQRREARQLIKTIILDDPDKLSLVRPGAERMLSPDYAEPNPLNMLDNPVQNKGWLNHPARVQWKDNLGALALYHDVCILAWKTRGYNNTLPFLSAPGKHKLPNWWGDDRFHSSHRSNLLRKAPEWYTHFGWKDDPEAPYFWPSEQPEYQLPQ